MRNIFEKKSLLVIAALALMSFIHGSALQVNAFGAALNAPPQAAKKGARADAVAPPAKETVSSLKIENSVVNVFATRRPPELGRPWTKQPAAEVTGSGLVIEGKRILTNAHVVMYAVQVQIQGSQEGNKISATVEYCAPEIDLAILKLEDESFFASHPALPRASVLPHAKDAVMVYGYPTGGNSMSITKGIVSRIDFVPYNYGVGGLRIQIDAAINPGNSGGPALVGDNVIGLAFSVLANAQNIGYIIPCEEIEIFLKDIADGHYDGKSSIHEDLQTLENAALRAYLKLDKTVEGIVVREPSNPDSSYPLKKWDVLTKIGDIAIDSQGNARIDDSLKVSFLYFVQKVIKNNLVPLTVVRNGAEIKIQLPATPQPVMLINPLKGAYPSYFVCGPIAFSTAVDELVGLISIGNNSSFGNTLSAAGNPMFARRSEKPAFDGEELVIVPSPLFTHPLTMGYRAPMLGVIKTINGIQVKNLLHLVEIIRDSKEEFLIIEFSGHNTESMVFPRAEFVASTEQILNDNGIRTQGTPDTMAVWNKANP
jgi:S1-C subfamily serine protease